MELKLVVRAIADRLGDELVPKVVAAVSDGLETGNLTRDDGSRTLGALAPFIVGEDQPSDETPTNDLQASPLSSSGVPLMQVPGCPADARGKTCTR